MNRPKGAATECIVPRVKICIQPETWTITSESIRLGMQASLPVSPPLPANISIPLLRLSTSGRVFKYLLNQSLHSAESHYRSSLELVPCVDSPIEAALEAHSILLGHALTIPVREKLRFRRHNIHT